MVELGAAEAAQRTASSAGTVLARAYVDNDVDAAVRSVPRLGRRRWPHQKAQQPTCSRVGSRRCVSQRHRLPAHGSSISSRIVDDRGLFARTFCAREFADHGLPSTFPQCEPVAQHPGRDPARDALQHDPAAESKLVRCTRGAIHDVIVDLRPESPTYRQWFAVELNAVDGRALFVPEGFAHGFLTLVDDTDVEYQMGDFYTPEAARGVRWNDPAFGIEWPRRTGRSSPPRDASYPDFDPAVLDDVIRPLDEADCRRDDRAGHGALPDLPLASPATACARRWT